jgi:hypothetical protein
MKRMLLLLSLAAFSSIVTAQAPSKPTVIKPSKTFEKCLQLDAGQKLEYRFESTGKLNFNLNYQKGPEETYYPVKLDRTTGESGLYEVKARNKYCLKWENRLDKDVDLTYSYRMSK